MKHLMLTTALLLLSGCLPFGGKDTASVAAPKTWVNGSPDVQVVEAESLRGWWRNFNDPALSALVDKALAQSPDRNIARARILEARGLQRSAQGSLFPQLGISAQGGRDNRAASSVGNFYEAGFDATYELDLFGQNSNSASAAGSALRATEAAYDDVSLSLIAEIARTYTELRNAERQAAIAAQNLQVQEKTLELIAHQKELGEAPQLDVERSAALVNTTKAAIPEFSRQGENARLRLGVLAGVLPEDIRSLVVPETGGPELNIAPVLLSPATVIQNRPDIRAATANFAAQASLADAALADLFPKITLGAFFGAQDTVLIGPTSVWSAGISAALTLLDFGRIRGQIDAADAREVQAYELWRKVQLQAVADVETALNDYARLQERRVLLERAAQSSRQSLQLSENLYKEGEVSFLDVLDAQRTANDSEAAVASAQALQAQSLIALYKSLGVY